MVKHNATEKTEIQTAILQAMQERGLNFQNLTNLLGRDRSTISRIINIPTDKLIAIEKLLNFLNLKISRMKRYRIEVELDNGNAIKAISVGNDEGDALEKLLSSKHAAEFIGKAKIHKISYEEIEFEKINPANYDFKQSETKPNFFACTDKKRLILLLFEKGNFCNQEIKFIYPEQITEANWLEIPTALREFADYVQQYQPQALTR